LWSLRKKTLQAASSKPNWGDWSIISESILKERIKITDEKRETHQKDEASEEGAGVDGRLVSMADEAELLDAAIGTSWGEGADGLGGLMKIWRGL
jgi:hypothetical protein